MTFHNFISFFFAFENAEVKWNKNENKFYPQTISLNRAKNNVSSKVPQTNESFVIESLNKIKDTIYTETFFINGYWKKSRKNLEFSKCYSLLILFQTSALLNFNLQMKIIYSQRMSKL